MTVYKAVLWFLGFERGEYITRMLKRQEIRLGLIWWLIISASISGVTMLLHQVLSTLWFAFVIYPVGMLGFILIWHVTKSKKP